MRVETVSKKKFECRFTREGVSADAAVTIEKEGLVINLPAEKKSVFFDYADLYDFRLLNYHLFLDRVDETWEISQLGYDTEEFFERLWEAYDARSREALFLSGAPLMETEGDFHFEEENAAAKGKAKIALYPDCVCILPHNACARRIPLCFTEEPAREGFRIFLKLDTGEKYEIARLGHDTDPFFENMTKRRQAVLQAWEKRLAELRPQNAFTEIFPDAVSGLFRPEDEGFWMAAVKDGRAAVEFFTDEKAATYLYSFDADVKTFTAILRHAMEATGTHRELIYLDEDKLNENPVYRMAVVRSRYVRFLRAHMAGRVIHTAAWGDRVREQV